MTLTRKSFLKGDILRALFGLVALLVMFNAYAVVDIRQSEIKWTGKKIGGEHFGYVPISKASLVLEKGKIKTGEVVVDLRNLTDADLDGEWKQKLETHLKSSDFFDVEKFPEAKIKILSSSQSELQAELTIKGKTNLVKIPYSGKNGVYTGQLKFDRTKFDMIYRSGNFFKDLGDKVIENEVTIDFKIINE